MRKLPLFVLALVFAVAAMGCDSTEVTTDLDRLVGTWALVGVSDASGDQSAAFQQGFDSVMLTLNADNTYSMVVDGAGVEPTTLANTFSVAEAASTLTLTVDFSGQSVTLPFTYTIDTDTQAALSTNAALLNPLFGTDLVGTATLSIQKVN